MSHERKTTPGKVVHWGRRDVLAAMGASLATGAWACTTEDGGGAGTSSSSGGGASSGGDGSSGLSTGGDGSGSTSRDGSTGRDDVSSSGEAESSEAGTTGACTEASDWAFGGTAAMTMKGCYPNPFAQGASSCALVCSTTEGPCTTEDSPEREDVSEGLTGLPVRMMLRFVDTDCNPIEGAEVRVWHTKVDGVYSGPTPSGAFCYGDQPDAASQMFFRGTQVSGADGVVAFDSCFPGWYSSRAVHVHFQVTLADSTWVVSQLIWDDALVDEICGSHPDYAEFGQPDTTSANDTVFGGTDDIEAYTFEVERMADGAMLAYKTITVKSGGPGCEAQGSGGGPP